jgi:hypothetical protein
MHRRTGAVPKSPGHHRIKRQFIELIQNKITKLNEIVETGELENIAAKYESLGKLIEAIAATPTPSETQPTSLHPPHQVQTPIKTEKFRPNVTPQKNVAVKLLATPQKNQQKRFE